MADSIPSPVTELSPEPRRHQPQSAAVSGGEGGRGGLRRTSTNRGMMKGSLMDPSPNVVEKATECDYEGLRC